MTDTFYIAYNETIGGTWYMLCVKETHFCIACGSDLERLLKSLKKCVKRVRYKERLMRELQGLDCGGRVSPATLEQRQEWYLHHGEDYADLVHSTVVEALREAREEDKENSPLRKATNRLKKAGRITALANTTEERVEKTPTPVEESPKILRKPRVFKHK